MGYVQWLRWRRETGSRPLKKRDGRSTTPEEEVALRRQVMEFLYDVGEEEEEEVATGARPGWLGVCGPGSRSQRLRKGTTAMPPELHHVGEDGPGLADG